MANDHAKCVTRWNPTAYPRLHAWLCKTDLVARAVVGVCVSICWHPLFVSAPTELGGRDALLVKAFDRPRIAKLVSELWLARHLRVALGNVDDFGASELCKHIELLSLKCCLQ